ncbi:WD40-repeat-containing domain protein [Lentinula raphanica]|nr:WD40-repeat-containing domain protein [Lentinula raphanica]
MKSSYTQLGTIDAPTDYVHALAFSKNGRYLASATNDDSVRVYDGQRSFMTVWEEKGRSPSTAVAWRDNALFFGSMDGLICFCYPTNWMLRRKSEVIHKADDAIHSLEFNQRGDSLLVCSGADVFLFEKTSGRWTYRDYLPRPRPFGEPNDSDIYPVIATGAHFLDDDRQCLIGYLYHGFWRFNLETWESTNCWGPDDSFDFNDPRRHYGRIAASAKSPDSKSIVATDACLGLQWFKVTPERLKNMSVTYHPQDISSNIPLPVLFINQGQAAIVGSTKGCALIFETKRGEKIQALKHGTDRTWITALACVELTDQCRMIATGDGNRGKQTKIIIWAEDRKVSSFTFLELRRIMRRISVHFLTVLHIVLILIGVISALSWLYPTLWTQVVGLGELARDPSSYKLNFIPVALIPSQHTAVPTATSYPVKKKVVELWDTFGELLTG